MALQTEFPILICDLNTDAMIGTDTLGSVLPHTLDIKNGLLFTEGVSLQLHRIDTALPGRVFTVGHSLIPPYSEAVLHCTIRTVGGQPMSSSGLLEGLTLFAENTGLVVGRTLVDHSNWSVPVLVSNFNQEAVMVEPFSEVGMVAQISAILSRSHTAALHAGKIRCPHIYKNYWTIHLGVINSVSWRVCCFSTQIYFRCPVQHLPVTRMQ